VWQDRRTESACRRLREQNLGEGIKHKTGLVLDPYFSASKIQ
jgi:glycerol kinase